jgi:hypothetical protein
MYFLFLLAQPFDEVYTKYLPQSGNKQSNLGSKVAVAASISNNTAEKGADGKSASEFYSKAVAAGNRTNNASGTTSVSNWDNYQPTESPGSSEVGAKGMDERFSAEQDPKSEGGMPLGSYRSHPRPPAEPQESSDATNWEEAEVLNFFKSNKWWSPGVEELEDGSSREEMPSSRNAYNTSYSVDDGEEYPLRPSDDFVHQSQVDNDPFQPYASSRSPMLLPGIVALESPRQPNLKSGSIKGDLGKLPGLDIGLGGIPKSREIGLEDRDWEDADDVLIEKSGGPSPEDGGLELSPGYLRSVGVADIRNGSRVSDAGNNLAPGSGKGVATGSNDLAPGGGGGGGGGTALGHKLPWSTGDGELKEDTFADQLAGIGRFGVGGGGLWDNTSWGTNHTSNSFMASAFAAAANPITSSPDRKHGSLQFPKDNSFPSTPQSLNNTLTPGAVKSRDTTLYRSGDQVVADIGDRKFFCLLCYLAFKTAGDLFQHCATLTHQEIAALDTGAERVWQYAPPPPKEGSTPVPKVCVRLVEL